MMMLMMMQKHSITNWLFTESLTLREIGEKKRNKKKEEHIILLIAELSEQLFTCVYSKSQCWARQLSLCTTCMWPCDLLEYRRNEWMNEWKRLLAEIKNIKLNTNNNIKQYIHQRCYQVTNNVYGNPKLLNINIIENVYSCQWPHHGHVIRYVQIVLILLKGKIALSIRWTVCSVFFTREHLNTLINSIGQTHIDY